MRTEKAAAARRSSTWRSGCPSFVSSQDFVFGRDPKMGRDLRSRTMAVLFALAAVFVLAARGAPSADTLQRMMSQTKTFRNVIEFNVSEYRDFALVGPRSYHLILIYSTKQEGCVGCRVMDRIFERVATDFVVSGAQKGNKGDLPVFFVYVDVMHNQKIVQLHKLEYIPVVGYIGPKELRLSEGELQAFDRETLVKKLGDRNVMPPTKPDNPRKEVKSFVESHISREAVVAPSLVDNLGKVLLVLGALGTLGVFALKSRSWLQKFPWLSAILALCVIFIAISGFFWSVQHGLVFFGYDRHSRSPVFFAPSTRSQYYGEGCIVAGLCILFGASVLGVAHIPRTKFFQAHPRQMNMTMIVLIILATMSYLMVQTFYARKAGWYNPSFYPPGDYIRGPLRADRRNTF